jgi:hypothetical protein
LQAKWHSHEKGDRSVAQAMGFLLVLATICKTLARGAPATTGYTDRTDTHCHRIKSANGDHIHANGHGIDDIIVCALLEALVNTLLMFLGLMLAAGPVALLSSQKKTQEIDWYNI